MEASTFDLPQFETYARVLAACACSRVPERQGEADLEPALAMARQSQDRWIEIIVLRAMAEQATGERRLDLLRRACEIAEQAEYRPEVERVRLALAQAAPESSSGKAVRGGARVTT